MAKSKPYQAPLSDQVAQEILEIPLPDEEVTQEPAEPPKTVGEKLQRALAALNEAVAAANEILDDHRVAKIVAESLAREAKKRGSASIKVSPHGEVMLHVSYDENDDGASTSDVIRSRWKSDLPKLDDLREEAQTLGIDISHLGRQRRAIYDLIQMEKSKLRGKHDEVTVSTSDSLAEFRKSKKRQKREAPQDPTAPDSEPREFLAGAG